MAGAARISIDFLKTRTANGGSSAVSYSASPAEFNVTFNKGDAECAQLGPITLEMQGQSLVPGTDSVPLQTLELQRKGDQPCQYSARLDSYTIDSYADGRHYDYRQYLRIKVRSAHALIDPFTHGEWFQLQLSGVPEND